MKKHLRMAIGAAAIGIACAGCEGEEPEPAGHWQLSPGYVASTIMLDDAVLKEEVADGRFLPEHPASFSPGLYARYRHMAARMGLAKTPALYLDTADRRPVPQAAARFSREGAPYILVNAQALAAWDDRELVAVLGHELVHLAERHVTAERIAEAYNHPEIAIGDEMEADRVGAGPRGSCDPEALEAALFIVMREGDTIAAENPAPPGEEKNSFSGRDHPLWAERKAALEAMAAMPPQGCRR